MKYRAMAKHFLYEAALNAYAGVDVDAGQICGIGEDFTPAQFRHFKEALDKEVERYTARMHAENVIS